MILEIKKYGTEVLRTKSVPVKKVDDSIRELLTNMVETMQEAEGVGLAAPQVGHNIRMFVIQLEGKVYKMVNPKITSLDNSVIEWEEGCLSVPGIYRKVKRPNHIKIEYLDENGVTQTREFTELGAVVCQHENDHLDGVLFVDKISPMAKRMIQKKLKQIVSDNNAG